MLSLENNEIMAMLFREGSIITFLESIEKALMILDRQGHVIFANRRTRKYLGKTTSGIQGKHLGALLSLPVKPDWLNDGSSYCGIPVQMGEVSGHVNMSPIEINRDIVGSIIVFEAGDQEVNCLNTLKLCNSISRELEAVFNSAYDEIIVSDATGIIQKMNVVCRDFYGADSEELVGSRVDDLEAQGLFYPSVTKMVIKDHKRTSILQRTKTGKALIVTGHPVFGPDGGLVAVVSMAKDITEMHQLQEKLEQAQHTASKYYYELQQLKQTVVSRNHIMSRSPKMARVIAMAEKIAKVDSNLLITGESGVGKSMLADMVHRLSDRSGGVMVSINCGAIPEALLESELFGYEKGAFTGAKAEGKPGKLEMADRGTLFLDEISEMPLQMQVKLLKVIQEKQLTRVGGNQNIRTDFRLIAATNRDLEKMVSAGRFREDLFYRLSVVPIEIPPLRERREDIVMLASYFWNRLNEKYGTNRKLDPEVYDILSRYGWPGNVRELENCMERILVTVDNDIIHAGDLPPFLLETSVRESGVGMMPLKDALDAVEKKLILNAYQRFGTTYRAAEVLGISQSTVARRLKKYGVNDPV